jgi:hypothetical protein
MAKSGRVISGVTHAGQRDRNATGAYADTSERRRHAAKGLRGAQAHDGIFDKDFAAPRRARARRDTMTPIKSQGPRSGQPAPAP